MGFYIREQRTEDRGQRTEDRGQRTEDRGQRTEDREQRTEDRGQRTEDRGQRTEDREQRTEDREQRTEDRGQRTEDREQRTEDREQRTEDRGQRTEDRGQRTENRGQRTENRGQRTEDREQRTEDRGQRTENRGQRTENRGQRTEDRGQRTEDREQRTEDREQRTEDRGQRTMKAAALFSGGLDSTLAIKVVLEQGIEVIALHFFSPFCTCDKKGCAFSAKKAGERLGIEFRANFLGEEYLSLVKNPKHGYGRNLNPCIDCRILLFKKAKEFMHSAGASFIITGEVLGQRPKSQHRRALKIIEQESGLEGLIVRPLSAKLLEPTIAEKKGWISRQKLLDFWGRSRKPQIELARIFGINDYPCPAGGCLLADPCFSKRVKDLLDYGDFDINNVELLKTGRHFRISPHLKLILGRNEAENNVISRLSQPADFCLQPKELKGPLGLTRGRLNSDDKKLCADILARYVNGGEGIVKIGIKQGAQEEEILAQPLKDDKISCLRI